MSIEASFGSINRSDTTTVILKDTDDGFLVVGDVQYRPSGWFWVFLVCTLWTWVGWLIPIAFYLIQKRTVQNGAQEVFRRVKNEFMSSVAQNPNKQVLSGLDQLEKLAALQEKGVITEQEFQAKKVELLKL
jgi:hypothetical protein